MLSVSLTLMVAAAQFANGAPFDARVEFVKPQVAAQRVAECGFKNVRSKFDGELQEDVVEVTNVASASVEQLRCTAVASLNTHYFVIFPAPVYQTYDALYWRLSRERDKADARAWLDKRGLLSRLPAYDPKRSDEIAFVHTLEALCGPKATGTLKPMPGGATFEDGALGTIAKDGPTKGKLDDETMWCLVNAAAASGYPLGFIGNEYYSH